MNQVESRYVEMVESMSKGEKIELDAMDALLVSKIKVEQID